MCKVGALRGRSRLMIIRYRWTILSLSLNPWPLEDFLCVRTCTPTLLPPINTPPSCTFWLEWEPTHHWQAKIRYYSIIYSHTQILRNKVTLRVGKCRSSWSQQRAPLATCFDSWDHIVTGSWIDSICWNKAACDDWYDGRWQLHLILIVFSVWLHHGHIPPKLPVENR